MHLSERCESFRNRRTIYPNRRSSSGGEEEAGVKDTSAEEG
jgi:hypothetical protein